MTDFLLELRSEEIPARMQAKAREDLARLFAAEMNARGEFVHLDPTTYATPRRLTLISRNLADRTETTSVEVKGPKTSAPPQALEGFLRKTGLTRDRLTERDGVYFAVTETPGRPMTDVLAEVIPAIVRAFPWPKSMRWGEPSRAMTSLRWVRPLQGIVALFGDAVVPVNIDGVESGAATLGHRFHHPGVITIGSAADYVEKLRACHVIVDQDERMALIRDRAKALASEAGLVLVEDEGLVAENAGLTEWPVPLFGRFDESFLDVPPEVIQLTARVNQKYFVLKNPPPQGEGDRSAQPSGGGPPTTSGTLANAFICTANVDATDGGATIAEGNRKVLAARLADARFFYDTDLKVPLEQQAEKLGKIVFHEKLGTLADKVDRVAKLARWLVEEVIVGEPSLPSATKHVTSAKAGVSGESAGKEPQETPAFAGVTPEGSDRARLANLAERAARLCKADLVTGMVGEFPELQGLMGGYYAAAQGEDRQVAEAIRDHYKPVGQGDEVPTAPVTVAVSLADKLDTLIAFFAFDAPPTGSRDPFALRRASIAVISQIFATRVRLPLAAVLQNSAVNVARKRAFEIVLEDGAYDSSRQAEWLELTEAVAKRTASDLLDFFADRLKVQQREAGVRHDLIDAVFALGGEDDLVRLLARTHALQAFVGTEDGANLLAGYKRAANILKKEGYGDLQSVTPAKAGVSSDGAGQEPQETPAFAGVTDDAARANPLSYTPEPCEAALIAALDSAEPAAARAVAAEEFEAAMAALASLRAPIDAFFDSVTVNDPDPARREARLRLLARIRAAVHNVADFSKIEG